jgi:hypothetical protein
VVLSQHGPGQQLSTHAQIDRHTAHNEGRLTWSTQALDDAPLASTANWRALKHTATSWDLTLNPKQHAELAIRRLLKAEHQWAIRHEDGRVAGAWLNPLPWDTEFFGLSMATMGLEGELSSASVRRLVQPALVEVAAEGVRHIRLSLRAGAYAALDTLQDLGFRLRWVSTQITCDTRRLPSELKTFPAGLDCVPAEPRHFAALEAIIRQIGPYNWPEFDPSLPEAARRRYVPQRLKNCLETDYADESLVALWRGQPVGFHASATTTHHELAPEPPPFAYVRDTFVSPTAPPNIGSHLIRAALHSHIGRARQVTGRVRLDGQAMLNTAIACGYLVTGDEVLLTAQLSHDGPVHR